VISCGKAGGNHHARNDRRSAKARTSSGAINTTRTVKAFYCGIEVEIVCQMNYCSLIRFNQRSFVVDTPTSLWSGILRNRNARAMSGRLEQ
jgi:hypothetical protein